MKGKLILIPLKEPKEGIKVLYKSITGYASDVIHTVTDKGEIWLSKGNEWVDLVFSPDELQQIGVEYLKGIYRFINNNIKPQPVIEILPLHPDDYEKALPLIGKEVEFEDVPICENCGGEYCDNGSCNGFIDWHIAKLIIPTPVMYTEEEVRIMCMNARGNFNKTDDKFDDWWNENKKK